jgi:O-succinylbenzoic acid--CoA ligase
MIGFLTPTFWNSTASHVASPPCGDTVGLQGFVESLFPTNGTCLFQTSGTESAPKWVVLTKESLRQSALAVNAHYGISVKDRWLLALPLWHVGGFGILARSFVSGSQVTALEGRWSPEAFVKLAIESRSTLTSLVPTQIFDIVTAGLKAPDSMRIALVGGAALSDEIEQAALKLGWPVRKTYGMTEAASQIASQRFAGGAFEVLSLWDLHTDTNDILTIRGPALAKGYIFQSKDGNWRWSEISETQGLCTRDRVFLSEVCGKRALSFIGREAGNIKILGELVSLNLIQTRIDSLRLSLGITEGDAAVCDVPDRRAGARLVLAFSKIIPKDAERLMNALNKEQRAFEQVQEARQVPTIPRGEMGKIFFELLRASLTS